MSFSSFLASERLLWLNKCVRKEGGVPGLGPRVGDTQDAKFGEREEDQGYGL